jgi:hypothetical protein
MHTEVQCAKLGQSLRRLESALLELSISYSLIHERHDRRGDGDRKVEEYMKEFSQLYDAHESDFPTSFPASLNLLLNDEDARYTTDVSPGMHCKHEIMRLYHTLQPNHKGSVTVWDLFCSPGMDILYLMLEDHLMRRNERESQGLDIVGVSRVGGTVERERFTRMQHNVASLQSFTPSTRAPRLISDTAKHHCENYSGKTPDIVLCSPPWMESMGDMQDELEGKVRSVESLITELAELVSLIKSKTKAAPEMLVCSVPYSWKHFQHALPELNKSSNRYTLHKGVKIIKNSSSDRNYTISTYYTFILCNSEAVTTEKGSFIYYV